jgi:MFS transporter, FHS family, L-fucose permease
MRTLSSRGTVAASCALFFALGVVTAAVGPALPNLAANTASGLSSLGVVFTAIFLGALLAQVVAGPLNDRLGQRPVLLVGIVLLMVGTAGLTTGRSLPLVLACALIAGLGHGAIDVSVNVLIAEVFVERSAAALNLLNVFFGVGAVAGPALAGLTLQLWGTALPSLWLGAGLFVLLAPLAPLLAVVPRTLHRAEQAAPAAPLYRSPLLWAIGALVLLYVGIENGIGGWTTAYLVQTTALTAATAALVTSGFWLALTVGRVAGAILGTRLAPHTLLRVSLIGSFAGGALLALTTGHALLSTVAVLMLGLCFGPIFPTALAITAANFRQATGTAASIVVALGSLGGMSLPWLQGVLLERGGPSASVLLVAAGTLVMLALHSMPRLLAVRRSRATGRRLESTGR